MITLHLDEAEHLQNMIFEFQQSALGVASITSNVVPRGSCRVVLTAEGYHSDAGAPHYLKFAVLNANNNSVGVPGSADTLSLVSTLSNRLIRPIVIPEGFRMALGSLDAIGGAAQLTLAIFYIDLIR